jgi:Predicted aminoglycoside phosphotransferase
MRRLGEAGYPVPRVEGFGDAAAGFGRPFLVMERINGTSLEAAYWSAPEEQQAQCHTLHGALMVRLHALEGRAILPNSPLAQAAAGDPYAAIDAEQATLAWQCDQLEGTEPRCLREALAWLSGRRATVACERPVVVHGDFHRNNVLLRAGGDGGASPVVIDWSNVRLADYRTDLAWTRLIASLAGSGGGPMNVALYERLAGRRVSDLSYFEVAACLRLLLSVLLILRFGASRQGLRPEVEVRTRNEADPARQVAGWLEQITGLPMRGFDAALTARTWRGLTE